MLLHMLRYKMNVGYGPINRITLSSHRHHKMLLAMLFLLLHVVFDVGTFVRKMKT